MIVLPMMGKSKRFRDAGYLLPKFMLPTRLGSLFTLSVNSFKEYFKTDLFLFIIPENDSIEKFVEMEINSLRIDNYIIVKLQNDTEGQADTVYQALKEVDSYSDEELIIYNIDSCRLEFKKPPNEEGRAGYLEVFEGEGDGWSFVLPGEGFAVLSTAEKIRISNLCSNGLYQFSNQEIFMDAFIAAVNSRATTKNEYYIAPLYNHLINNKRVVRYITIDSKVMLNLGTPLDYENYISSSH